MPAHTVDHDRGGPTAHASPRPLPREGLKRCQTALRQGASHAKQQCTKKCAHSYRRNGRKPEGPRRAQGRIRRSGSCLAEPIGVPENQQSATDDRAAVLQELVDLEPVGSHLHERGRQHVKPLDSPSIHVREGIPHSVRQRADQQRYHHQTQPVRSPQRQSIREGGQTGQVTGRQEGKERALQNRVEDHKQREADRQTEEHQSGQRVAEAG